MGGAVGGQKPRGMELAGFGRAISCCGIGMTGGGAAHTGAGSGMAGAVFLASGPSARAEVTGTPPEKKLTGSGSCCASKTSDVNCAANGGGGCML